MPTFRCLLACTTFGLLRSFLRLSCRLGCVWLVRGRVLVATACVSPWRGPPGSRAWCWGSPVPSVLPRRALLCSALCPGVLACLARGRGVRPFRALAVCLAVRLCRLLLTCGFGHVCFCAAARWGRGACSCFPHLAPCHLVLPFAFGRSLRSPWWPILPLSGLSVCFSSRLFARHLFLALHARHLAVIRLVLLPTSCLPVVDWA